MGGPKGHVQTESELGGRPVSEPERRSVRVLSFQLIACLDTWPQPVACAPRK